MSSYQWKLQIWRRKCLYKVQNDLKGNVHSAIQNIQTLNDSDQNNNCIHLKYEKWVGEHHETLKFIYLNKQHLTKPLFKDCKSDLWQ